MRSAPVVLDQATPISILLIDILAILSRMSRLASQFGIGTRTSDVLIWGPCNVISRSHNVLIPGVISWVEG